MTCLSSDSPCTNPSEDKLDYAPFAEALAKGIAESAPTGGMVIALYGPWGSGKSTIINFLEYYLENNTHNYKLTRFNPWWFAGRENLTRDLIESIESALSDDKETYRKLESYIHKYAESIGCILDTATSLSGYGAVFGKAISAYTAPKEIITLKENIVGELIKHEQRILIIADDIDSLTPDEMLEFFTVIKTLADFPYVMYLLAFDKEIVYKSLGSRLDYQPSINDDVVENGKRFLQKIVQVEFDIPPIERYAISDMLMSHICNIIPESALQKDQEHWNKVFDELRMLFSSPRDIVRYANALSISYPAVEEIVDPADFAAIEAIRILYPDLYLTIKTFPARFTRMDDVEEISYHIDNEKLNIFHQKWQNNLPLFYKDTITSLINIIFPRLTGILYNVEEESEWAECFRICHRDTISSYFRLSFPNNQVNPREVEALLNLSESEISNKLTEYHKLNRCKMLQFLEILNRKTNMFSKNAIIYCVSSFFNIGDSLADATNLYIDDSLDILRRICNITSNLILLFEDTDFNKLKISLDNGQAIITQITTLATIHYKIHNMDNYKFSECINELSQILNTKILTLINSDSSWIPQHLIRTLSSWSYFGNISNIKDFCKKQITNDSQLMNFLNAMLFEIEEFENNRLIVKKYFDVKQWNTYIDINTLRDRITQFMTNNHLNTNEEKTVNLIITAIDNYKQQDIA